jgi:hypothetical protein
MYHNITLTLIGCKVVILVRSLGERNSVTGICSVGKSGKAGRCSETRQVSFPARGDSFGKVLGTYNASPQ